MIRLDFNQENWTKIFSINKKVLINKFEPAKKPTGCHNIIIIRKAELLEKGVKTKLINTPDGKDIFQLN